MDGRQEDAVITRTGAIVGRLDHIFKDATAIREAQIYQPQIGELIVRIVPEKNFGNHQKQSLLEEFKKRLGEDTSIEIRIVDKIERNSRGKLRFVVSDVKPQHVQ